MTFLQAEIFRQLFFYYFMAIDKEKSVLKPSKNNFGLFRANFSVLKDQNSRSISFEWAKISGKLFFYLKMKIGKEKRFP